MKLQLLYGFHIGFLANAIAWRLDQQRYDDAILPAMILAISIVVIVLQIQKENR